MNVPVLGHPSLEESYPSLANQSSTRGQAEWSKGSRGSAPSRKISFVSLVAYGPKVFYSALATVGGGGGLGGGYSFWIQAGWFPTDFHSNSEGDLHTNISTFLPASLSTSFLSHLFANPKMYPHWILLLNLHYSLRPASCTCNCSLNWRFVWGRTTSFCPPYPSP